MRERLYRWVFSGNSLGGRDRDAQRCLWFTLVMVAAAFAFVPVYLALGSPAAAAILSVAGAFAVPAVPAVLRLTGSAVAAGNLLVSLTVAAVLLLCFRTGGGGAMLLAWLTLAPLLGVALAGLRSALVWTLLCGAAVCVVLAAETAGWGWFTQDLTPAGMRLMEALSLCGLLPCALMLALIFERGERAAREDLEASRREADLANRAKGEFLANTSHEIRTPMTAILGYADWLLGCVTDPEQRESVRTIKRNGEHLLEIINDILDQSKIEAGQFGVEFGRSSPIEIVRDVVTLMRERAGAKGLALLVEYASHIPETIETDALRLRQVLLNLVGNAIKFTESGSVRVVVRLLDDGSRPGQIEFTIEDTGIGLTADQMDRLFRPFVQADGTTTRRHGGSGLGLVISRRLAEMLGGGIAVESTPGRGSRFCVTVATGLLGGVPLIPPGGASLPECGGDAAGACRALLPEPPLRARVLLAEDGPDNQRLLSFLLRKSGATVTVADDGRAAVALALAARADGRPFDVILMDMQMPVLDGYDATRLLRSAGYAGPIVALTAHAMETDREQCLAAGCDDYAPKPIDRARLVELVRTHAQGTPRPSAA